MKLDFYHNLKRKGFSSSISLAGIMLLSLVLFFACNPEDEIEVLTEKETAILRVGNIDLRMVNAAMPFARMEAFSTWEHIFAPNATIFLENTATGVIYDFSFNPNTLDPTVTLTIPYGFYRYSLEVTGGDMEDFLPFNASGIVEINAPTHELTLNGITNYGLVTFSSNLVSTATISTATETKGMTLTTDGEYYYMYVRNGTEVTLDIVESYAGTDISTTFTVDPYEHYHFYIIPPFESELSFVISIGAFGFQETIFEIGRVRDIDGNSYRITRIDDQVWMAENLKVTHFRNGDAIPQATNAGEWANAASNGTPAWAYYNFDAANGAIYGILYNWYAVNDPRGLAPDSYHIPTATEWDNLEAFLGTDASGKLKQTGTSLWNTPNTGATNFYGFSALPAGRINDLAVSAFLSEATAFWTSTTFSGSTANVRSLNHTSSDISISNRNRGFGYSVRALKN